MTDALLSIRNLKTFFFTEAGVVKALDGVTFDVRKGETLGLVGESGSGKTVTALSAMQIIPKPGRTVGGDIIWEGESLLKKSEKEMRELRGSRIAMVFQDPSSSLNPIFSIEQQLTEIVRVHLKTDLQTARDRVLQVLRLVGIPEAEKRLREYPHQFSGGMRQRVAVARALLLEPDLLFADEPTTNLDVTIQAQVLDLMKELNRKLGMAMVLITHDMGIVASMTHRVVVLYAGQVGEIALTRELFGKPTHPYTRALLGSVPRLDVRKTLQIIPGNVPNLITPPSGCRFHPRCKYAFSKCSQEAPVLKEVGPEHFVACHAWREVVGVSK